LISKAKKLRRQDLTDVGNKELTEMGQTKTVPFLYGTGGF
jgi:phage host-nuclease inhibitor protein Gam